MNLLLIEQRELGPGGVFYLRDSRVSHLRKVLKTQVGERLRAGVIGGVVGEAELLHIDRDEAGFRFNELSGPTLPQPIQLIIALPRPQIFKRILEFSASVAISQLTFINAARVESSYFQAGILDGATIHRHLLLGMEQGCSTYLPQVFIHEGIQPCRGLPKLAPDLSELTVFHPESAVEVSRPRQLERQQLVIGPEGGWTSEEVAAFHAAGCHFRSLSSFILRTDNAVVYAVATCRNK